MVEKKLLISIGALVAGGAERVLSILSSPFADAFGKVAILIWRSLPVFYEVDSRVEIVDIESLSGSTCSFKKMLWFRKYVLSQQPDIVLSFLYPWSMRVIPALWFTNVKIVVAERLDGRIVVGGWPVRMIRDLLYLRACKILVQTGDNRNYYIKPLQKKISVIYNPILISEASIGKGLNAQKDNLIVSVGRLHKQKNFEMLIRAFGDFYQSHSDFKLIIYGEGSYRGYLEKLIEKLGLKNVIFLPGNKSNIYDLISSAKMFVLSSDYEGMPNALIEAMCIGLPCISTRVSGASELIKDGYNGYLVDVGNCSELSEAMAEIIDNEKKSIEMAMNAVEIYKDMNYSKITKQWVNFMAQLIN